MEITLRYFDGCPNWQVADERLATALAAAGTEATVHRERVETPEEAERLGFTGSPTLLLEGTDPFRLPGAKAGLLCRVYQTPAGLQGAPTVEQIVKALERTTRQGSPP